MGEISAGHPAERQPEAVESQGGRQPRYVSFWKIWIPVAAIFVLLDATFNLYFWRIPKLSKANADYGYQFMVDGLSAWRQGAADSTRVVALGSSIALSFDPRQVQSLLNAAAPQRNFEVHRLLLPGAHPSDYALYLDSLDMERVPDVVVLLVNLVDFLYPNTERNVNPTLRFILPPWDLLLQRYDRMSIASVLDAAMSGTSRLYRYRKLIRSSVQDHVRAVGRWLRGGPPAKAYGIDADGYTRQRFGVPVTVGGPTVVKYFIDPEWIRQRGRVRLEFSAGGDVVATQVADSSGWKSVTLSVDPEGAKVIDVRADSAWTARAANATGEPQLRGVLLADRPPQPSAAGAKGFRYRLWDEGENDDFLRMGGTTGDEFARTWKATLEAQTRFGQRFRVYRDAKLSLCRQPFSGGGEYEAVKDLVDFFRAKGARVLIVNSPESPWILDEYRETPYYRGYLDFFRGLAAAAPGVEFYDWSAALPAEDFNDWHHPTYIGAIKMGTLYAEALATLPQASGERSH